MTSIIHFKKEVNSYNARCTTNRTAGGNWSNKVQQNDPHSEKRKLQNKILKNFKCAQDFAEIIAKG